MQADDVADIRDEHWDRMLAVNLTGAMRVCRAAIPLMRAGGGGAIVNVSSVAAFNGSAGMASYSAGKAGLVARLTRALANEYGQYGIRANCLCPGWVRTPMSEEEMSQAAAARHRRRGGVRVAHPGASPCAAFAAPAEIARLRTSSWRWTTPPSSPEPRWWPTAVRAHPRRRPGHLTGERRPAVVPGPAGVQDGGPATPGHPSRRTP